jgi:hypothetical protein
LPPKRRGLKGAHVEGGGPTLFWEVELEEEAGQPVVGRQCNENIKRKSGTATEEDDVGSWTLTFA